jgi:KDO2-lipid IV(A) lauroyltransferase
VYHVLRYRRATVAENLAAAFPERSAAERLAIEKGFYRHLCDLGVEVLASRTLPMEEIRRRVVLENPEVLESFRTQRQSLILMTCHQGNWEWLAPALGGVLECPIDGVYKPLHDEAMNEFILESRIRSGQPIRFKDAGREILRRRREYRGFALLADQAPFKRDKRHWHDFLGRPGSFYLGPQKIAEACQYPVLYFAMTRTQRGHYRVRTEILALPPHAKGGTAVLDSYIDAAERAIRAQPETWLWSNRKWKHAPPPETLPKGPNGTSSTQQTEAH